MLSDEERQEIEAEFPHYPNRRAVCIDALKIVQKHRGWISDEALQRHLRIAGHVKRGPGRRRHFL